jgi:hypothetical protein
MGEVEPSTTNIFILVVSGAPDHIIFSHLSICKGTFLFLFFLVRLKIYNIRSKPQEGRKIEDKPTNVVHT